MSLCVGIDFSTKRVDLAAIAFDPDGEPTTPLRARFDVHRIGAAGDAKRPIDYQRVRADLRDALARLERWESGLWERRDDQVAAVCVEAPAGKVHPSLHAMHGAILASIPSRVSACSIYPVQWRKRLGLIGRDSKVGGHELVIQQWLHAIDPTWDEHELDALGIATAWRTIQWEAAA